MDLKNLFMWRRNYIFLPLGGENDHNNIIIYLIFFLIYLELYIYLNKKKKMKYILLKNNNYKI